MKIVLIFIIAVLLIERFDVLNKEPISGLINPITYLILNLKVSITINIS